MFTALRRFYQTRRNTTWILGALAVAVLVFAAFRLTDRGEIQFFTAEVIRGDIVQIVNSTGTIDAVTTVEVGSQVSGMITELRADFNSVVRRGQVIARIDPAPFRARVLQAEADLASARASVRGLEADRAVAEANHVKARAVLRESKINLARSTELLAQGINSNQQHESVEVAQETAQANLQAAQALVRQLDAREDQTHAQVSQREAQLEQTHLNLEHTIIRAPIDGTVIARSVNLGQTVAASLSAPTLFTIAQDLTKMLVYAKTDETDVGKIVEGAEVTFTVDSFPTETFRGSVLQVRMNATTIQNVVTYDTVIEFDNPTRKLLPGMTAYVTIPVGAARDVVKIPNGALRFQPELPEQMLGGLLEKHNLGPRPAPPRQAEKVMDEAGGEEAGGQEKKSKEKKSERRDDRAARRERFRNMSPAERARMRQQFAGRRRGQGENRKKKTEGPRATWQRVWKLTEQGALVPVDIQVGLTDYTFTALLQGELEEGEQLVIGQTQGAGGPSSRNPSLRRAMRRF